MLGQFTDQQSRLAILDMEASLEHMSRGTVRHVDTLLIVAEPYYRSLETAGRIATLARELNIPAVYAVANKTRDQRDSTAIQEYCARHDLSIAADVPFDEKVTEADRTGASLLDCAPASPAMKEITRLAGWLMETR